MDGWVPRDRALEMLGLRAQTLYAYTSRGRIGVRVDPQDPRKSLYRVEDLIALQARGARGRKTADIAASALAWGEPAITTSISTMRHGVLIYRGENALTWARTATLEQTAALLWQAQPQSVQFPPSAMPAENPFTALSALAATEPPTFGRSRDRMQHDAQRAIGELATSLSAANIDGPIHQRLAHAWSLGDADTERLRIALVALADHELNASTFAARVAASTGASIAASLLAGLCALSGPRHGGAGRAVVALMNEAAHLGPQEAIDAWLSRGLSLPGFGHTLYPSGDPRAIVVMEGIDMDALTQALRETALERTGLAPNIDFALAAWARSAPLPPTAPFSIFLLGRSIGWAAHSMEQAAEGTLIRPRAAYQGREFAGSAPQEHHNP